MVDGAGLDRPRWPGAARAAARSSVRSTARRSSGTALVSLWTRPLTSAHQAAAAAFAACEVGEGSEPDEEVASWHSPRGAPRPPSISGSAGLAEVGPEAVVGGEGDIARCRHDDVGHDATLETAHAVGEHDRRAPRRAARSTRRAGASVVAWSSRSAKRTKRQRLQASTAQKTLQPVLLAPVEDEVLAGDGLPGSIDAPCATMLGLGVGDGPPEASGPSRCSPRPDRAAGGAWR